MFNFATQGGHGFSDFILTVPLSVVMVGCEVVIPHPSYIGTL